MPLLKRPKAAPVAKRAGSDTEIEAVLDAASPALRLPIVLGAYLGARQGDILRMTWAAFDGQGFTFTQGKTGEGAHLPRACATRSGNDLPMLDAIRATFRRGLVIGPRPWLSTMPRKPTGGCA